MKLLLPENDVRWAPLCAPERIDGLMIAFEGDLGSGKSSLIRHWLRTMGVQGAIRSPTYTLCEYYEPPGHSKVIHIDAYRLKTADDWDMLGLDLMDSETWSLWVEWCSIHPRYYARCDLHIHIDMLPEDNQRSYELFALSEKGKDWLAQVAVIFNV